MSHQNISESSMDITEDDQLSPMFAIRAVAPVHAGVFQAHDAEVESYRVKRVEFMYVMLIGKDPSA